MLKTRRALCLILACVIMLLACIAGIVSFNSANNTSSQKFQADLKGLYSTYDVDVDYDSITSRLELKRLIVSNYDGKDYGCVSKAVDKKNGIAVLQFDSTDAVKDAYKKAVSDGYTVDYDFVATLTDTNNNELYSTNQTYQKGELYPLGSQTIGSKAFLDNYAMDYDDVTVAVIDTGVMYDHPLLEGRFVNNGIDFSRDECENAYYDTSFSGELYEHATFISGIIANNTPDNVKILPYKVVPFGTKSATVSSMIAAINSAIENGADVINLSIVSGSGESAFTKALNSCVKNNIFLCTSSGNNGNLAIDYPASIDGAITVSALNSKCDSIASFSNFGDCIDFAAPGTKIYSSVPSPNGPSYDYLSGTSFATPYVSAAFCNVLSVDNTFTYNQAYDTVKEFATDYGSAGFDEYYGYGVPNLGNMQYTDENSTYTLDIPQGVLTINESVDYSKSNQPWSQYSSKIKNVTVNEDANTIGAYAFYNVENASFNVDQELTSIGDFAFYNCKNLSSITLGLDISYIGADAFYGISDGFVINGYRNTYAESFAKSNGYAFNPIGCNHNYLINVVEPTDNIDGYTEYTCSVCGDSYTDDYIETIVVSSGACGENASYSLTNIGKLTINGNGAMYQYIDSEAPWYEYKNDIKSVEIGDNISFVSPYAFYNCKNISEFVCDSECYKSVDRSLYSADETQLILAVNNSSGAYVMPNKAITFDATAFLVSSNISVVPNDDYYIDMSILYDNDGNIVMALPSYKSESLSINSDITVNENAFILTNYPNSIRVNSTNVVLDDYSVGYHYDNAFVKDDLVYYGYIEAPAYQYAIDNEFDIDLMNSGSCGEDVTWRYNVDTKTLNLYGTGRMEKYTTRADIPWYTYISSIERLIISNDITYISPYSFFNASALKELTMPLSMDAPTSQTIWYNAKNIETINLTYGNGVMKDYGSSLTSIVYTYTPWYISRDSLTTLNIDSNVKRIGAFSFRGNMLLESLTLNSCDTIAKYALYDCYNLSSIINYSKSTSYLTDCIFKYSNPVDELPRLYGYDDSTARDYSVDKDNFEFVSLGCEHSRGMRVEGERPVCCYDSNASFYCVDCNVHFYDEFITAEGNGHYVKANVLTTEGKPIPDAEVYVDGVLSAITNNYGKFVVDEIYCEKEHTIEIKKHGITLALTTINTNGHHRYGDVKVKYGNFINDSAVNGKDFAFAKKHGYTDLKIMDYGKISGESVKITNSYINQATPSVVNSFIEPSENGVDGIFDFSFEVKLGNEYTVTEIGYLYGKNMNDSELTLDMVGKKAQSGYTVKSSTTPVNSNLKKIDYGSTGKTGIVSARLYIKYTNGVKDYTYYSDVLSYEY